MTNGYDSLLRRTNVAALHGPDFLTSAIYGYDNASRLSDVSDGTNAALYSYLANSPLVGQITYQQSDATRMTTSKQYDFLNRLSSISSTASSAFAYQYDSANQRTLSRLGDGSYWRYDYDSLGQMISGNKFWSDQSPVAGQQFDYTFDTIGNRTQTEAGGDQNGANLRLASYSANSLNQITSRAVPSYVDVMGDGLANNAVLVNGQSAYRKGEYFRQQFGVTNTAPVWQSVTVAASGQGSVTGHIYVPENPEVYTYDADGNLLSDGRWSYTWDGENRLLSMTSLAGAPSGSQMQLEFAYDWQGRRIQKMVLTNNGGGYVGQYTNSYLYDGRNCLAILGPGDALADSFLWGNDLSGSMQGAGGVGGLLAINAGSNGVHFVAYDGNGNVDSLINAANQNLSANYAYGPFGELIRATGPMAKVNPFRFSTKYHDDESDLLYYGYRYYNPSTGRWLSRDPINELSFNSFYRNGLGRKRFHSKPYEDYLFVGNDSINKIDWNGLLVLLEAHQAVSHTGINHSFLTLMVSCDSVFYSDPRFNHTAGSGGLHYATVGAGPGRFLGETLISGVNRPRDVDRSRVDYSAVIPDPSGLTDDDFIREILNENSRYDDEADYLLFPQDDPDNDGYNSNGYASGLLKITTGSIPAAPPNTPGFNHPVPPQYFNGK